MASSKKMYPDSDSIFQQQFETVRSHLFLPETEDSWDTIARSVSALAALCSDAESYTPAELVVTMRSISRPLISAMNSERSRLSGVAIDLIAVVASSLGVAFDPLIAHFFPVLLVLSSRTSKVTVARARACILTIIDATHLPSILSYLLQSVTDKSVSMRLTIVESTLACMNCFNPPDLEKDARAKEIEVIIRTTARDANADVRTVSRKVFEAYKLLLPSRLESFAIPLTPTTRKYLNIQNKPIDKLRLPPSKPAHLSSSTSAMRGPSSRRPPTHTRSASSPAVEVGVPSHIDQHPPRNRGKVEMAPPRLPEPIQPSRRPVMSRSATAVERPRVVSMSATVRPGVHIPKPGVAERGRPIPMSHQSAGRLQTVDDAHQAPKTSSVVARRVPISGAQKQDAEKATRPHPRIDNSASTPAMRQPSAPTPPLAGGSKPAVPRPIRSKDGASVNRIVGKPKSKEATKSNLMQPTLSQLSRAKTNERRAPVPTAPRPQRAKTAPPKPIPTGKGESRAAASIVAPLPDAPDAASASTTSDIAGHEPKVEVGKEGEVNEEASTAETKEDLATDTRPETTPENAGKLSENAGNSGDEARITVTASPPNSGLATPVKVENSINALMLSIERGFIFTPSAPLSPPQSYLALAPPTNLTIPFPLQAMWSQRNEESDESGDKPMEGLRRLESRRALGDVAINK